MKQNPLRGEVLVALLKDRADFGILQEQGWYRIPLKHAPKRWPPRWLAFYLPKAFGGEAYSVRYYGEVADIQVVKRRELFPHEFDSLKSDQEYYRIRLKSLEQRERPIVSSRPRRLVLVPTTWEKFSRAAQINELFDESPLEDRLWGELKKLSIKAERQWRVQAALRFYLLDFALFCTEGQVDVETDGDSWHLGKERVAQDNQRDNDLQKQAWHILRFNGQQINAQAGSYCIKVIQETINQLGGMADEGIVPRVFYTQGGESAQQLSLFEAPEISYEAEEGDFFDLE